MMVVRLLLLLKILVVLVRLLLLLKKMTMNRRDQTMTALLTGIVVVLVVCHLPKAIVNVYECYQVRITTNMIIINMIAIANAIAITRLWLTLFNPALFGPFNNRVVGMGNGHR